MTKIILIAALAFASSAAQAHIGPRTQLAENCVVSEAVKLSKGNRKSAESLANEAIAQCEEHLPGARQEVLEKATIGFGGRSDQAERATYTLMNDFIERMKQMAISAITIDRLSKP